MVVTEAAKAMKAAVPLAPTATSAVPVWATAHRVMVNAQSSLLSALHVAMIVPHVMGIASQAKANANPVNSTTVVLATMHHAHHAHHATLTHPVRLAVTMTTSSPVPTRTWAPKVASMPLAIKHKAVVSANLTPHAPVWTS